MQFLANKVQYLRTDAR